jgi:hypothetical protein
MDSRMNNVYLLQGTVITLETANLEKNSHFRKGLCQNNNLLVLM